MSALVPNTATALPEAYLPILIEVAELSLYTERLLVGLAVPMPKFPLASKVALITEFAPKCNLFVPWLYSILPLYASSPVVLSAKI